MFSYKSVAVHYSRVSVCTFNICLFVYTLFQYGGTYMLKDLFKLTQLIFLDEIKGNLVNPRTNFQKVRCLCITKEVYYS